jgi:hypothetical protein
LGISTSQREWSLQGIARGAVLASKVKERTEIVTLAVQGNALYFAEEDGVIAAIKGSVQGTVQPSH